MIFNYKRVSTELQNTERQLLGVACDREYEDKLSGKDVNRPQLQLMLDNLRKGDVIQVHSMDRLARNVKDLLNIIEEILDKGCSIKFFKENMTFSNNQKTDLFQKLMLTMIGAISEFERNLILERQKEGIAIAKAKHVYKGGVKKLSAIDVEKLKAMVDKNQSITSIAKELGITRQSVYNYLKDDS